MNALFLYHFLFRTSPINSNMTGSKLPPAIQSLNEPYDSSKINNSDVNIFTVIYHELSSNNLRPIFRYKQPI